MKLGEILIRLRNSGRLTQREVAEFVGVKQNTYQSWECDNTSVKVVFLPKLAEIFGVALTELLPPCHATHLGTKHDSSGRQLQSPSISGTYSDYRDELIAAQKREIDLLELHIVDLQSRLSGGWG